MHKSDQNRQLALFDERTEDEPLGSQANINVDVRVRSIDAQLSQYLIREKGVDPNIAKVCEYVHAATGNGELSIHLSEVGIALHIEPDTILKHQTVFHAQRLVKAPADILLIVFLDRLYLSRFWNLWVEVNDSLANLSQATTDIGCSQPAKLDQASEEKGWRQELRQGLSSERVQLLEGLSGRSVHLVSGGPGTGKTTLAASLLAWFASVDMNLSANKSPNWRYVCLAPTGKAAAHLEQSVHRNILEIITQVPKCESALRDLASQMEAKTIHRYISEYPGLEDPFPTSDTKLYHYPQLLIVDEASMIDLQLMHKLLSRVRIGAVLIMLGDASQLGPVEVGECYRHWIGDSSVRLPMIDKCLIELTHSYRFRGGIAQLADSVRDGDEVNAQQMFQEHEDIERYSLDEISIEHLCSRYELFWQSVMSGQNAAELAKVFASYQILCAVHDGPYGSQGINQLLKKAHQNWLAKHHSGDRAYEALPVGTPLMITRNQYDLGVYNGDIGFVAEIQRDDLVERVWVMPSTDQDIQIPLSRLKDYQLAYAITIHKSQGSEFARVDIVLPPISLLSPRRALLYTAVTRARNHCCIYSEDHAISQYTRSA